MIRVGLFCGKNRKVKAGCRCSADLYDHRITSKLKTKDLADALTALNAAVCFGFQNMILFHNVHPGSIRQAN